jgi:hypothetical protein
MRLLARRLDRANYRFEDRLGAVLMLFCMTVLQAIAYWYPLYLCAYHASPDDRYGFAMLYAFPFWVGGLVIAGRAAFRLLRAVVWGGGTVSNVTFALIGGALALTSLSPALTFIYSLLR